MKFIHIADVHLGAEPEAGAALRGRRGREIWDTFEHVIDVCEEQNTDLLLIAGDLFHRQPLLKELKEADSMFATLNHTKVVLIAGNHDYIRSDSYYRTFRWSQNVFPLLEETPEYIEFPELETAVYGLSYHHREITEPLYDDLEPLGKQPFEILLGHGGDERHIPIDRRMLERSGFAYVAMGHIHKPQALVKNRIIYAGALEPVDKNDTGLHGYVQGEITEKGVRTRWIPCARRSYIHLELTVDETDTQRSVRNRIGQEINNYGNDNIYKIELNGCRDADISFDTDYLLQQAAESGNVLEVLDGSVPAYDFERLYRENRDNLLGKYIDRFRGCNEESEEYQALCEGVEVLLACRREGGGAW